ncbi:MAG: M15 family metallopeptidase [Ilumatobacteraceae bacterium]
MLRSRLTRTAGLLVVVSAMWAAIPGSAATPEAVIGAAATGGAPARNLTAPGDLVSIYNFGPLQSSVSNAAISAAAQAGGWGVEGRGFGIGLVMLTRGGVPIHVAPGPFGSWYFPTSVTALPMDSIAAAMGRDVSKIISAGQVVVGQTSASITGAQAGDVLHLVSADGSVVQFLVGRVAPDAEVGGTEIVMSTAQAGTLGAVIPTSVLIYGQFDRTTLDAALAARGIGVDPKIRVRRSWDPFDPDNTIGLARTKKLLGEFAYNVTASGAVLVDDSWRAAYIPGREAYPTGIVASCNNAIKADLTAALQAVVNAGLAGEIDVGNANTYGGCFGPRFSRIVGTQLGSLSRHTWAQALDTNTVSNCQGCVPQMDCRVVRIFRAHNFAWGGNFLNPDGMHFEWVGEPRNTYLYPSRYCPNVASGGLESFGLERGSRSVMFADDGWALAGE